MRSPEKRLDLAVRSHLKVAGGALPGSGEVKGSSYCRDCHIMMPIILLVLMMGGGKEKKTSRFDL
jgi:hypothetical protein